MKTLIAKRFYIFFVIAIFIAASLPATARHNSGSAAWKLTTPGGPVILTSGPPLEALTTVSGTHSDSTIFGVSGAHLTAPILITAPTGFEISTNPYTGFGPSATVGVGGAFTFIYVRLAAADAVNTYSGNIVLTSPGATTVTIATAPSTVTSTTTIFAINSQQSGPANAAHVQYDVYFNTTVAGVTASNFSVTTTGTISGASVSTVSGSGTHYTVTVNTGTGDGTIKVNLANSTGITPGISTALPFAGQTTTIQKTATALSRLYFLSSNANYAYGKVGDVLTLYFGTVAPVQSQSVTIGGYSVTPVSAGGNDFTASYTLTANDVEGRIHFVYTYTDFAGNISSYNDQAAGDYTYFDKTLPTVTIGNPSISSTTTGPVTYSVTYADVNFNTSSLSPANVTLNTTGTATGTVGVSGSGTTYIVTISNISGSGTLGISIAAATATDLAGNNAAAAGPSSTFAVLSSIATLSNLGLSIGTLTPSFAPGTNGYSISVSNATTSVAVIPTLTDSHATVKVNGTLVTSGTSSTDVPLAVGPNTITAIVTAQDGTTSDTYTISVTRGLSSFTAPTVNASAIKFSNTNFTGTTAKWKNGNGSSVIVFMAKTSAGTPVPVNGITYTASSTFAAGTQIGTSGWYCVYNGPDSSVVISNLVAATGYRLSPMAYNGTPGSEVYLSTDLPPSDPHYIASRVNVSNVTTLDITPVNPARYVTFSNTTFTGTSASWTNGNGMARAVFISKGSNGGAFPVDGTSYLANTTFAAGDQVGSTGWYCVYNGVGSSINIAGLITGTTYRVAVIEYNVISSVQKYLTTGQSPANVTTIMTDPTVPAMHVVFVGTTFTGTTASWTNGNGSGRLAFIYKGSNGGTFPLDGTIYNSSTMYGLGDQVGTTGWYCIYNGTSNSVNITGLTQGTTYRVTVIEYNVIGGVEKYLTTRQSPANVLTMGIAPVNSFYQGTNEFDPLVSSLTQEETSKVEANNILSPNGDGVNDTWVVKNIELYPNSMVTVYDRKGNIVYAKKGYTNDWDGTYRGSVLNADTYYYQVSLGNGSSLKGFITVVKD